MAVLLRFADRTFGNVIVARLISCSAWIDCRRRRRDFPAFLRLRGSLVEDFWGELDAGLHYKTMIHAWHRSVATTLLCDRLHDPDWTGRIKVCGQPPQALPEWGQRPVVLTFLHTGGYVILRYWLRSQGVAATTYVSGIPAILKTWQARRTFAAADGRYDLHGVPHFFYAPADLRRARDSLTPGRVLLMALDGGCATLSDEYALVGGQSIRLTNGAARTAAAAGAVLVGAAVRLTKDDCFRIHFTSPVPDEILRNGDPRTANRVLLDQLWPEIAAHPEVLGWSTLEAFFPDPAGPYLHWP